MEKQCDALHLMHGSMFVLLERFVVDTYDHSTWLKLLEWAGVEHTSFQMHEMYPTHEIFAIVGCLGESTEQPVFDLMEQFGEFMVPDLMLLYSRYVRPEWRTYEMLINTEDAMHGAVRREDNRTNPPKLLVTKKGVDQLMIEYSSKRRMAGVAVGIVKGIASYFDESDKVEVMLLSPADAERVQIKVDFLN
ncbi:heme NO-binding domain-containing protein [Pontibacter pamirensis]|uniref:heme NO-binding domain-containing protein n=1 Tax=Pontibacter pamirensis TaxID=2562824 RepID=UPI00138A21EF|nr:heme NO-binding domain-containing protein [Pontibacter pamirensis]